MLFRYQLSGDEDGDPLWKPDSTEADLEEHEGFLPRGRPALLEARPRHRRSRHHRADRVVPGGLSAGSPP